MSKFKIKALVTITVICIGVGGFVYYNNSKHIQTTGVGAQLIDQSKLEDIMSTLATEKGDEIKANLPEITQSEIDEYKQKNESYYTVTLDSGELTLRTIPSNIGDIININDVDYKVVESREATDEEVNNTIKEQILNLKFMMAVKEEALRTYTKDN